MKKKVLLLPTYFPSKKFPVVGSQIQEQTELLSQEFDFRVLYCMPGMGWKRFLWYGFLGLITGKRKYKDCTDQLICGSLNVSGVYYFQSPYFSHSINQKFQVKAYRFLLEKLIKEGWVPDLIHARTAEYAGVYGAHLAKEYKIPYLLTENCVFILEENISLQKIRDYRFAIESANAVAVVSNYLKSFLLTNNFKCNPVTVGNWINENKFSVIDQKRNENIFTVLSIGHTGFTKDWPTFFKAIYYLIYEKKVTDIKILIAVTQVYDDISRNYIPALAKEYKVEDYCEIVNEVPRSEIVKLYHQADVLISSSLNETFGIATAEAMFCGVPVVATDNGGINDFICDKNGIKVELRDYKALAEGIMQIKNKSKIFSPAETRDSVLFKFGTEAFKKRISDVYIQTISGNGEKENVAP